MFLSIPDSVKILTCSEQTFCCDSKSRLMSHVDGIDVLNILDVLLNYHIDSRVVKKLFFKSKMYEK